MSNIRSVPELDAAIDAAKAHADETVAALARELFDALGGDRKTFVAHMMKRHGYSRTWAYQHAKVATQGAKAIKTERTRNTKSKATARKNPGRPGRGAGFDRTAAWTDAEIEAQTGGKIATEAESILLDMRGLAKFALRVESLNLAAAEPTDADRRIAQSVITAWTKALHNLGG